MNQKKLWKIEELWEKYYVPLIGVSLKEGIQEERTHTCPAHNINLADISVGNNSPFRFSFGEQKSDNVITNEGKQAHTVIANEVKQSHIHFSELVSESIPAEKIKLLYKNNISIYNPDFHLVQEFNFKKSEKPVHSDEYGEYFGLKYSQVLEKDGKLIYLFDNHNKIIQAFLEYAEIIKGGSKASYRGFDVVHIDAHDDDAVFASQKPHHLELKNVQKYIQQTRISDFFDFLSGLSLRGVERSVMTKQSHVRFPEPAYRTGRFSSGSRIYQSDEIPGQAWNDKLINKIHRYTTSTDFQEFKKPQNPYVLSLDIDIFGPEGGFTDLESKVKIIAQAWRHADAVCIATSPGFIEQDYAHKIIEILTKRETDELI